MITAEGWRALAMLHGQLTLESGGGRRAGKCQPHILVSTIYIYKVSVKLDVACASV